MMMMLQRIGLFSTQNSVSSSFSCYCYVNYPKKDQSHTLDHPNLKPLTSRIVRLTRRRQLRQIFEEVEAAKKQHGGVNIIVMNAVMQACVHCGDIDSALRIFADMCKSDSCGVDNVTYGTLLKTQLARVEVLEKECLPEYYRGLASQCLLLDLDLLRVKMKGKQKLDLVSFWDSSFDKI